MYYIYLKISPNCNLNVIYSISYSLTLRVICITKKVILCVFFYETNVLGYAVFYILWLDTQRVYAMWRTIGFSWTLQNKIIK